MKPVTATALVIGELADTEAELRAESIEALHTALGQRDRSAARVRQLVQDRRR